MATCMSASMCVCGCVYSCVWLRVCVLICWLAPPALRGSGASGAAWGSASVRIAGGVGGGEPPYLIMPTPLPLVKIRPRGVEFQPPHLSFSEVGMLLDSHFLPMQFLKYLQCDDLNVTTILIHIEDYGLFSPGLSVKFY